eukprot:TRINITY_DN16362_c0_g1_i1.p1 TRINITY_DN16362_c0_g1~~TRINITY_DN16362_c0_g1_i1.p1  ORF type:complete len:520 (+),score=129.57 TRINITY_DN16362_c0_g1_i1:77-1561(+)
MAPASGAKKKKKKTPKPVSPRTRAAGIPLPGWRVTAPDLGRPFLGSPQASEQRRYQLQQLDEAVARVQQKRRSRAAGGGAAAARREPSPAGDPPAQSQDESPPELQRSPALSALSAARAEQTRRRRRNPVLLRLQRMLARALCEPAPAPPGGDEGAAAAEGSAGSAASPPVSPAGSPSRRASRPAVVGCSPHLRLSECPIAAARKRRQERAEAERRAAARSTPTPASPVKEVSRRLYDHEAFRRVLKVIRDPSEPLGVTWHPGTARVESVKPGSPFARAGGNRFIGFTVRELLDSGPVADGEDIAARITGKREINFVFPGNRVKPTADSPPAKLVSAEATVERMHYLSLRRSKEVSKNVLWKYDPRPGKDECRVPLPNGGGWKVIPKRKVPRWQVQTAVTRLYHSAEINALKMEGKYEELLRPDPEKPPLTISRDAVLAMGHRLCDASMQRGKEVVAGLAATYLRRPCEPKRVDEAVRQQAALRLYPGAAPSSA